MKVKRTIMASRSSAWIQPFTPQLRPLRDTAPKCRVLRVLTKQGARSNVATIFCHAGCHDGGEDASNVEAPHEAPKIVWDGSSINADHLIERVKFNSAGLVAAVAQQVDTKEVLMMAWMNEESIRETMRGGIVVYYSRSRQKLWRKGESSGHVQHVHDVILDCDGDTILLLVDQIGVACHTGRRSCFYTSYQPPFGEEKEIMQVLVDPEKMYGSSH